MSYIERIIKNVCNIKENQFRDFYGNIQEADCLILVAEGRSESAMFVGLGQMNKTMITVGDVDFPGRDIIEAAPILEKKYKKIALIVNSGSGETSFPEQVVRELVEHINREKSKKFTVNVITSKPTSSLGEQGRQFGTIVELKGREENRKEEEPSEEGIMNDVYELGSMVLFQKLKESINEGKDYQAVFSKIEQETEIIKQIVNDFVASDVYQENIRNMETRVKVVIGGKGPGRNVAKITAIRLQHVKRVLCGEANLAGPFAPRTQAADVLLLISWSGENATVLDWARNHKEMGGYVSSIVGKESHLSRESKSFIIDAPPTIFYERAAFALSPLPLHLLERIRKRGYKIPDWLVRWLAHTPFE